jgi:hypothetical protein
VSNSPDERDRGRWKFDEAFALLGETVDRL